MVSVAVTRWPPQPANAPSPSYVLCDSREPSRFAVARTQEEGRLGSTAAGDGPSSLGSNQVPRARRKQPALRARVRQDFACVDGLLARPHIVMSVASESRYPVGSETTHAVAAAKCQQWGPECGDGAGPAPASAGGRAG